MDKPAVKVSFHSLLTLNPLPPPPRWNGSKGTLAYVLFGGGKVQLHVGQISGIGRRNTGVEAL